MASTTPNIGLTLPVGTENVSRQILNDNFSKIDTEFGNQSQAISDLQGSYSFGTDTLANIQSAIVTFVGTMSNGEQKNIIFNISTASTPFSSAIYIGRVERITATRFRVEVAEAVYNTTKIIGRYKDGTWTWQQLVAGKSYGTAIKTKEITANGTESGYTCTGYRFVMMSVIGNSANHFEYLIPVGATFRQRTEINVSSTIYARATWELNTTTGNLTVSDIAAGTWSGQTFTLYGVM